MRSSSSSSLVAVWASVGAALTAGCASDLPLDAEGDPSALVVTDRCTLAGLGGLADGDFLMGDVRGGDSGASGSWLHVGGGHAVLGTSGWIVCRLNGAVLADVGGSALVDGVPGYTFRVQVRDEGDPGPPVWAPGMTSFQTVVARRTYQPSSWEDGVVPIGERGIVLVPSKLLVTSGNAGNHYAWITFVRAEHEDTVVCRYRGGADHPNPCTDEDLEAGTYYLFEACEVDAPGNPPVAQGDFVDVLSAVMHVEDGARVLPTGYVTETAVTVEFEVTPLELRELPRDYYRVAVWNAATGAQVLLREGELASGNLGVTQLD